MILTAHDRTVAPTDLVLSVDLAKLSARVSHTSEDQSFETWIKAATEWVEAYTGRAIRTQTHRYVLSGWAWEFWLPMAAPLGAISHVKYYDTSNVLQTWASSNYRAVTAHEPAMVEIDTNASPPSLYDRSDAVVVTYTAGWATEDDVPSALVQAVQLIVTHWYENRESVLVGSISKEIEFGVVALCAPYRVWHREPVCR